MFGSERQRGILYQVLLLAIVVGVGWYLVSNTLHNLSSRQIQVGFGFLGCLGRWSVPLNCRRPPGDRSCRRR